jgi:hypothetical protein
MRNQATEYIIMFSNLNESISFHLSPNIYLYFIYIFNKQIRKMDTGIKHATNTRIILLYFFFLPILGSVTQV